MIILNLVPPGTCHRQVPEGRGWVLDGFPVNVSQARLLETALSGADPDQVEGKRRSKRPHLVEDRNAPKAPPPPLPALHLAVLLEVSDEQVLDRAFGLCREFTAFRLHSVLIVESGPSDCVKSFFNISQQSR